MKLSCNSMVGLNEDKDLIMNGIDISDELSNIKFKFN